MERRHAAGAQHLQRLLVAEHREDRDVQGHALAEGIEGVGHPSMAERGARGQPGGGHGRAIVHRLPEQGDPRLLPQHPPHQERRVDRGGQDRAGGHLGRVHRGGEATGGHAQMHVQARGRALQGDVVPGRLEALGALDADLEGPPAQAAEPGVQRPVARGVAHRRGAEVLGPQGGQDPHRDRAGAVDRGGGLDARERPREVVGDRRERGAGQPLRRAVVLEVEAVQLELETGLVRGRDDLVVDRGRLGPLVDQAHLQLDPHRVAPLAEARPREQLLQGHQALATALGEPLAILRTGAAVLDLLTHGAPRDGGTRGAGGARTSGSAGAARGRRAR